MINHNLRSNNEALIILERHEALTVNQRSLLFANSDTTFTINQSFFHKGNAFIIDELDEDWNVIKRYLNMQYLKDTIGSAFIKYCTDCDYYIVKRIYINHDNQVHADTLYSGNFP
jgi:hypothetical protein